MPPLRTATKLKLAYAALATADTLLAGSPRPAAHKARVLTKPFLMPTLAASLATDPMAAGSSLRNTTLAAQAGGWGGDVLLMRHGTASFAAGAGSFGLGHLAYIAGFRKQRPAGADITRARGPRVVAGLWAVSAPVLAVGAYRRERALGPAVAGYSALLAAMVATASQLDRSMPADARRLTMAGAALFMASDTVLGLRKFVLSDPPPQLESVVMATYTGAQLLLAEGAARAGR